ncbi:ankyrin repeats (3 copies) domain-containing protein [Trichoderma breve]|uniref:Ankyrin repeats (3 copies) domain-containing protein n=1 Tax=Trichoderma breve TaxID=2034170 RepID=A0A9W9BAM9_9HYPO|nr:ankyrin repeats (3 copies) domain-containing protein [Trichoderma breve]KAJ4859748.1 ankyrin repeats (3 copies) domain-containing protein [Trichoderma breve]
MEDSTLVEDYERKLQGNVSTALILPLGVKENVREQMDIILRKKMDEVTQTAWKLKFGGAEIHMRDLLPPILAIISHANDYITASLRTNMYASIAWAGVSLLLPLFLRPSTQAASLLKGLESISSLIVQSRMREELYHRRYKSRGSIGGFELLHDDYKKVLEALYREILRFQMTSYCYYANNGAFRLGLDIIKWNDWDALMDKVRRHEEIMQNWGTTNISISSLQKVIQDANEQRGRQDLLSWLSNADPTLFYNTNRDMHENGTGEWLLQESPKFRAWKDSSGSFLWIHGKAGCGKSVLSSTVIKYLETRRIQSPTVAVAYFYFSFTLSKEHNVNTMLSSLIKQICCCRPDIPEAAQKLGEFKTKGGQPDTERLEEVLLSSVYGFSAVYIIIDGLDECAKLGGHRKKLLKSLRSILTNAPDNLHILCTSRNEPDIRTGLSPALSAPTRIELDLQSQRNMIDHDIGRYVDSTLSSDEEYKSWPEKVKVQARKVLIEKSDGMFQYVRYQFEALRGLNSMFRVNEALQNLPTGLDETYNRMFQNIHSNFRQEVISLLKWLCFSNEILTLDMLADIFILRPDCDAVLTVEDQLFSSDDVLKYLSGLVITYKVKPDDQRGYNQEKDAFYHDYSYSPGEVKVRLAHFSIKEYLTSDRMREGFMSDFSFTDIDAHLWIAHSGANRYRTQEDLDLALQDAALGGNKAIVEKLLHEGANVNAKGKPFGNALLAAASKGHLAIVNLLLDKGADIEAEGSSISDWDRTLRLSTPLQLAGRNGQLADVNIVDCNASALYEAASRGYWDEFDLLLDKGADVNLPGKLGYPLHGLMSLNMLVHKRRPLDRVLERMKRLLDLGADPNASTETSGTPLYRACTNNLFIDYGYMTPIALFLIERGADVNIFREKYGNLFQADEVFFGQSAMELLLENGADISTWAQVGECGSVLHTACYERDLPLVELLLDHGADVHSRCGVFDSILQAACGHPRRVPDVQILKLLLDCGVDINAQGGKYGTALQAACFCGKGTPNDTTKRVAIVQFLLDHGAEVNLEGGEYGTALQAACATSSGGFDTIQLLLDLGADVNLAGGKYGLPLQAACAVEPQVLDDYRAPPAYTNLDSLAHGAMTLLTANSCQSIDVNAQGGIFGTALQAAAYSGQTRSVRMLLERGAQISIWGGKYRNALNAAVIRGHWDIVDILLEKGREQSCQFIENGDEAWLGQIRQEHGEGAVQRWEAFWKVHGNRIV